MKKTIDVLYVLRNKLNIKSNVALANLLDVKPASLRTALHRNSVPFEKIINLAEEKVISLNDIFFDINIVEKNKAQLESYEKTLVKSTRQKFITTFALFSGKNKLLVYPKKKFKKVVVSISQSGSFTSADSKTQLTSQIIGFMDGADTMTEKLFDKNQFQTLLQDLMDNYDENEIYILIKYVDEVLDFIAN